MKQIRRSSKNKSQQKMWISLLATVGLSTAIFLLKQYSSGNAEKMVQSLLSGSSNESAQME